MAHNETQRAFQALVDSGMSTSSGSRESQLLNLQLDRRKKQHEALASQILGKGRRTSTPTGTRPTGPGASLASRVGVNKVRTQLQDVREVILTRDTQRSSSSSGTNGPWTHDLHDSRGGRPRLASLRTQSTSNIERENQLQKSLNRGGMAQFNVTSSSSGRQSGGQLSIRGMASGGPFVVIASNFAPGTTAADIESAMAPVGLTLQGEQCLQRCRVLSNQPTVLAELEFADRQGAENVVATFNNQKADGRVLYVYMKPGGPTPVRIESVPVAAAAAANTRQESGGSNTAAGEDTEMQLDDIMVVDTVGDGRNNARNDLGRLNSYQNGRDGTYQDGRYGYEERAGEYDMPSGQPRGRANPVASSSSSSYPRRYDERLYNGRAYGASGSRRY